MSAVVDELPLVDHHCHGVLREPVERAQFESFLTEADAPRRWHGSLFDTQAGMGVRAVCAPLLDLSRHADAEAYLARRAKLGVAEVTRRMLTATGVSDYVVDTGFMADVLTSPTELAENTGANAHEIVRLETVAEQVLAEVDPSAFADAFRTALPRRASGSVGFKSIAAYRVGLDLDPERPTDAQVATAAAAVDRTGPIRIADRTLTRFLVWTAIDLGRPVQFHVGYGDSDVDLNRCDPLLLTPFLRATAERAVPIMLLHNYPFHRHAAYLAQVFDHVFVDVGLALHNVGTRADALLAELLELAPFGSVLFSSDAFGLPELYALNATLFRRALSSFLDNGIARDQWSADEAARIAGMLCSGNARRVYNIGAP